MFSDGGTSSHPFASSVASHPTTASPPHYPHLAFPYLPISWTRSKSSLPRGVRLVIDDDHRDETRSGHVSLRRSEGPCAGGRSEEDVAKSRGQELHPYENLEAYLVTFWDTLRLYSSTSPRPALSCLLSPLSPAIIFPSCPSSSLRHHIPSSCVRHLHPSQFSPATISRMCFPPVSYLLLLLSAVCALSRSSSTFSLEPEVLRERNSRERREEDIREITMGISRRAHMYLHAAE